MEIDSDSNYNNITNCTVIAENNLAVSIYNSDLNNIVNSTLSAGNRTVYIVLAQNNTITGSDIVSDDIALIFADTNYNRFYSNNIIGRIDLSLSNYPNYFTSEDEVNYTYGGENYTGILGNYWYLYNEEDAVIENGTWSIPYVINGNTNDSKPLAGLWNKETNRIVDEYAEAFNEISANLTAGGVSNNLDDVDMSNYDSFEGLYFEATGLGRVTFTENLNLSDPETQNFLIGLEDRFTLTDGRIAFNVTGSELNGTGATIEFYNIDEIMYSSDFTADDIYEYLVAYSDNGTALDISELVTSYELDGTTFRFNVTHFTVYEIAYDDGLIHIKQEDFNNETGYIINESGYYVLDENIINPVGIFINSNNVIIDGMGYSITGDYGEDRSGINNINYSNWTGVSLQNITIKNTALINWYDGICICNMSDLTIVNCSFFENDYAIDSWDLFDGTVSNCTFESNNLGIYLSDSENMILTYNSFVGNDEGLNIYAVNNWIYLNKFEDNIENVNFEAVVSNYFHSPVVTYEYEGVAYEGRLGNYYGEELGTSNAGIFDRPYGIIGELRRAD